MDYLIEKVSYLRGLADGLQVDDSTNEGKIISGILDVLDDMAKIVADLDSDYFELEELVDEIDEDLADLEDEVFGDDNDDDYDDDDQEFYEIECPKCNEQIFVDEDSFFDDVIICPNCEEKIEFDLDDVHDCCGCEDCE